MTMKVAIRRRFPPPPPLIIPLIEITELDPQHLLATPPRPAAASLR